MPGRENPARRGAHATQGRRGRLRSLLAAQLTLALAAAVGVLVGWSTPAAADTFTAPGFSTEVVATLPSFTPVGLAYAPDGRLFVWQKSGIVRVVKNGALLSTPFIDISARVNHNDDRGLLGFAFDPDFANNGYVYLTYVYENTNDTSDPGPKTSRLTRVTANPTNPDVALPGSEIVILGSIGVPPCSNYPADADCIAADDTSHTIDTVAFAPDGTMLVSNGDGAHASFADPLSFRAQDLNSYSGKILRINRDGTAPHDNPFYDGTNSIRSKVWLYGVRNPFRFSIQPGTGEIWFGDVGWNTWEEINRGLRGANYGWPCYEGASVNTPFAGFAQCASLPASAVVMPYYTYSHTVGTAAVGGPFYTATAYPQEYQGSFFFSDYSGNFIKRVTFDANHNPTGVQTFATDVAAPVSMIVGPDGLIYYVSFTTGQVRRIRSNGPAAIATATPSYGYSPLTVAFSSASTVNPGGGPLTYLWNFGDGGSSTQANPSHTYTSATVHAYTASLTVTDSAGLSSTGTVTVTVGSVPPTPTISSPANGTVVNPGEVVTYQGSATDPEDGPLSGSALGWTVLLHHNSHVHVFAAGTGSSGSFTVEDHGPIGTFSYEVILTATDSSGLQASTSITLPVTSDTTPPSTPTGLAGTPVGSDRVNLSWAPSTDDNVVTGYRVERCSGVGCTTFTEVGTPTSTTFTDLGLTPSTSYSYRVRASDASGNLSGYSSVVSVTTGAAQQVPPGLVAGYSFDAGSGGTAIDLSGNGNNGTLNGATWTTGKFGGGLSFNGSSTVSVPSSPSLSPTTSLTLAAWIKPSASQSGWRTIVQKQTDAWVLNASNSNGPLYPSGGATLAGSFQWVSGSQSSPLNAWTHVAVTYDGSTMRLYVNGVQVNSKAVAGAIQTTTSPLWIGGNSPYGEYFIGVIDEVQVFNRALSPAEVVTAMNNPVGSSTPDTTPPTVPTGLAATAQGGSQINLTWSASTDNVGVAGYRVERCQGTGCSSFSQVGTPTGTTFNDTGLTPSTSYSYRVRAVDAANNLSGYSSVASATTSTGGDTTPPSAPSGLTATAISTSQIDLAWTASTDNVGVTLYRIERCQGSNCTTFVEVGTSTTTAFSNTGLAAGTTYRFRVRAADAAGNLSAYSSIVARATLAADTTKPSAPTNLAGVAVGPTQINLTWTASTDNVGVAGYRVERCQGSGCTTWAQIAAPLSPNYNDSGRAPSTTYRYRVRAADAAGNLSNYSTAITVSTPSAPDTTPPTTPGNLVATALGTTINLTWTASTDDVGVSGYRVERCSGVGCSNFAQVATPGATSYGDVGLSPSTSYSYRVLAADAAGNVSGYSAVASATTGSAPTIPPGLVAGYSFDAGAGGTCADVSGNGNTATITGATWVAGKYGNALSFDGIANVVSVASSTSLNLTTQITLAAWIKPNSTQSGWRTILQKQTDAWVLNASNSNGALFPSGGGTVGGSWQWVSGSQANPVGVWTHVAMTYDGTTMRLYVNGAQVASKAVGGAIQTTSSPLWMGGNSPYGEYFNGVIDEVQIYNRALSAAEVTSIMSTPLG